MAKVHMVIKNGEEHYSVEGAARFFQMSPRKLKSSMLEMGLEYTNHRNSTRIWIPLSSIEACRKRIYDAARQAAARD
jgi:hypothetical protein